MRSVRFTAVLYFALVPALLSSCALFEGEDAEVAFLWFFPPGNVMPEGGVPGIRVTFTDGRHVRVLEKEDMTRVHAAQFEAGPFDTEASGTLYVGCAVHPEGGPASAEGVVALPLRSDWRYQVTCTVMNRSPLEDCFGCTGASSFALAPVSGRVPSDSLFIVWGGNFISNPVIY